MRHQLENKDATPGPVIKKLENKKLENNDGAGYQESQQLTKAAHSLTSRSLQSLQTAMMRALVLAFSSFFILTHSQSNVQEKTAGRQECSTVKVDSVVFCAPDEHHLEKRTLVTTLKKLGKEWSVSLEFKPKHFSHSSTKNIIHLTTNSLDSSQNDIYGRIAALWIEPNNTLIFSSSLVNSSGHKIISIQKVHSGSFQVDQWSSIKMSQQLENNTHRQKVTIDGREEVEIMNFGAQEFSQVNVFASNPWQPPQPGLIRNFVIIDGSTGNTGPSSCFYRKVFFIMKH